MAKAEEITGIILSLSIGQKIVLLKEMKKGE